MSEMIELVREAIVEAMARKTDLDGLARAAIEAMRDPTSSMVFAAGDKTKQVGGGDFVALWTAMVDAALADSAL